MDLRQQLAEAIKAREAAEQRAARFQAELENIANANPWKWDVEMRDQFRPWAQNRARHALKSSAQEQP